MEARHRNLDAWLHGFLFKALARAYHALKLGGGGFLAINISDVWVKEVSAICDPMSDYLLSLGASYCDCWGVQMNKRPRGQVDHEGVFCGPLWIFRKGPALEVSGFGDNLYLRSPREVGS